MEENGPAPKSGSSSGTREVSLVPFPRSLLSQVSHNQNQGVKLGRNPRTMLQELRRRIPATNLHLPGL